MFILNKYNEASSTLVIFSFSSSDNSMYCVSIKIFNVYLIITIKFLESRMLSFFMSVFSNPPKMFVLTDKERIFYGLLISYFFTYIIAYLI